MSIRRNASCGDLQNRVYYPKPVNTVKNLTLTYVNDKSSNFYSQLTIKYKDAQFVTFLSDSTYRLKIRNI